VPPRREGVEGLRVGPALKFLISYVSLTRQQEGARSAAATGISLISEELKKVPARIRISRMTADRPLRTRPLNFAARGTRTERSRQLNVERVRRDLGILGIDVIPVSLSVAELERHRREYQYPRTYAGGTVKKGGARESKILEYFVALQLVNIEPSDVVIDVASERSLFPDVVRTLIGARVYRQDLIYPSGVERDRIGGSAADMPVGNDFADALTLHNSFEHFEGTADTDFIREAWRVLRRGGSVCIIPLFLAERYEILTDPLVQTEDVTWDPDADVVEAVGYRNRFGRFYSPAALARRVVRPARECGFSVDVFQFENARELEPTCSLDFGLVLRKPTNPKPEATSRTGPISAAHRGAHSTHFWSLGALVLATLLWLLVVADVGQPARAIGVLAFLSGAPLMIVSRFARGLHPLERANIGLSSAVALSGVLAGVTLAVGVWTSREAILALSAVIGIGALLDISLRLKGDLRVRGLTEVAVPVTHEQQVVIDLHEPVSSPAARAPAAAGGRIHLNSATLEELATLPRIGPVTARKILDYRAAHGSFSSVEELDAVPGIGPARLAEVKPLVDL
jgi:competence ComEA-like helix-hairpin-helix protein